MLYIWVQSTCLDVQYFLRYQACGWFWDTSLAPMATATQRSLCWFTLTFHQRHASIEMHGDCCFCSRLQHYAKEGVSFPVGLRWQTIHDCAFCNADRPNIWAFLVSKFVLPCAVCCSCCRALCCTPPHMSDFGSIVSLDASHLMMHCLQEGREQAWESLK